MRKMTLCKVLVFLLVLLLAASCSGAAQRPEEPAEPDADGDQTDSPELKIAVLIPSSPTDGGWGQLGAEGIRDASAELGFHATIVEAGTADLMRSEAEGLAAEGFHIIVGHGGQYATPFSEVCEDWPDSYFITVGGRLVKDNLSPCEYFFERAYFVQGAMAAKMTETGNIGLVIGGQFPSYMQTSRAFEMGCHYIDPTINVMLSVTQDATDMSEGYELTMSQISAGADVIWSNANQASLGSIQAAKERGVWIFGTVKCPADEAPDLVVASVEQYMSAMYAKAIQQYYAGTLGGDVLTVYEEDGGYALVFNKRVTDQLPKEITGLYDELMPKVIDGTIYVPRENEGWD